MPGSGRGGWKRASDGNAPAAYSTAHPSAQAARVANRMDVLGSTCYAIESLRGLLELSTEDDGDPFVISTFLPQEARFSARSHRIGYHDADQNHIQDKDANSYITANCESVFFAHYSCDRGIGGDIADGDTLSHFGVLIKT
jgi:hypothetical protein